MRLLTHSCFLLLLLGRLFLLALLSSLESPPSFTVSSPYPLHALALISFFPCQGVALAHIDSLSFLMIWCSGLTALFLFVLAKAALAYLPTVLSVAPKSLFPSQLAQYVQASLLKPAPFCMLFAGLGNTNKSATSLLLLSDSHSVLSSIFPFTSISLANLAGTVFSLLLF